MIRKVLKSISDFFIKIDREYDEYPPKPLKKEEVPPESILPTGEIAEITIPQFDEKKSTASIDKWLIKVGDIVEYGDIIVEVSTDKVTMEFEAFYTGKVVYLLPCQENVPVGTVICKIEGI